MSTIGVTFISDAKRIAVAYNPYDIAYAKIFDKNKIATPILDDILSDSQTPLTSLKTIGFISKPYITILNDENLNTNLGTHIKVEKGCFISLYQIVKDDGYTHDTSEISSLDIPTKHGTNTYKPKGKITKVLFNNPLILTNAHYIILSNKDYQNIRNITKQYDMGTIMLMDFTDWHKTEDVSMELQRKLQTYNMKNTRQFYDSINDDILMFKPTSKIRYYLDNKQSGSYLLFLCSYVGILFLLSSAVILHFKLLTEYEDEKIKYKILYKIGITDNEVSKLILKELKVLFFLPFILATFVAAFYSYNLPVKQGAGLVTLTYSLIISLIYCCFQTVFYLFYKKLYIRKLIKDLEK